MPLTYGGLVSGPDDDQALTGKRGSDSADQVGVFPSGRVRALDGVEIKSKEGTPADGDLVETDSITDAVLVWDDTNDKLFVRKPDGTYVSVALT